MGDGRLVGKGLHHTSLHIPCAAHMLKLSIFFIFVVFLLPFSCVDLDVVFSDMESVLTEILRTKSGAATGKYVEADGGFAQAANWLNVLATAVYAESQDVKRERHDSTGKLAGPLGLCAVSSVMVLATDRAALVYHTSAVVSPLCVDHWFWPLALPTERLVHGKTPMRSLWKNKWPSRVVSLILAACASFWRVKMAHPLLRSTGPSARRLPVMLLQY